PEPDPETAVGGERGGAEHVTVPELPHASQHLAKTTVGERVPKPGIAAGAVHQVRVGGRQQEGGKGESGQAQRGRIGSGRRLNGAELLGHIGPPYVSWPGAHG